MYLPSRCGYLKTNAIQNDWDQYWAAIVGTQLVLHSSEDNLNSLKVINLSPNVQCKTAKRSTYDFRFILIASACECYEFKCTSAHDRREWITALEKAAGVADKEGLNAMCKISEIVTKIRNRETESQLEKIKEESREGEERRLRQHEEVLKQQQRKQQYTEAKSDHVYELRPSQQIPPLTEVPPPTSPQSKQSQRQQYFESGHFHGLIPVNSPQGNLLPHQTDGNMEIGDEGMYELMTVCNKLEQQQPELNTLEDYQSVYELVTSSSKRPPLFPPSPKQLPPRPPPQKLEEKKGRKHHVQIVDNGHNSYDDFRPDIIQEHKLLPQQSSPETLQKRMEKEHETSEKWRESFDNYQDLYDDFSVDCTTEQQERERQKEQSNSNNDGQELYEQIPENSNCNERNVNQDGNTQDKEFYATIHANQVECQQGQQQRRKRQEQKNSNETKTKKIFPLFHNKKQKKNENMHKKEKQELKQTQKAPTYEAVIVEQHVQDETQAKPLKLKEKEVVENVLNEISNEENKEEQAKSSRDFEQHVQILLKAMQGNDLSSAGSEEGPNGQVKSRITDSDDTCTSEENIPERLVGAGKERIVITEGN